MEKAWEAPSPPAGEELGAEESSIYLGADVSMCKRRIPVAAC